MRKKHPEHANHERWLVSYADFITLLFAFFVIMYAISKADLTKFKQVSQSMKNAFNGPEAAGPEFFEDVPEGKTPGTGADGELQGVREMLEESISLELGMTETSDRPQMIFDDRGLVVRLAAKDFFGDGEVAVREDFRPLLDRIGRVLAKTRRMIRIEGHADPREVLSERYPSHWELSAARAAWVVRYWVKRLNLDPTRLGAAGYGSFRPLSTKTDEWNRAKNRRVEIIIL